MKTLLIILKVIVNALLFMFYTLIFIIASNFIFWLVLDVVLNKDVPWSDDPIHTKMAVLVIFLSLLVTLLFRKFFYINIFTSEKKKIGNEKKDNDSKIEPKDEDLEIYVNKEIK